jgi:hypothetical protein
VPTPAATKELRGGRAQPADADHEGMRRGELLLRVGPELGQEDVPAVAQQLRVGQLGDADGHGVIIK